MREYFLMVVGAAVLSALASVMTPDKWRKYIQLVTGIVILCCITMPVARFLGQDSIFVMPDKTEPSMYDENLHTDLVMEELTKRVENDIEERMMREYEKTIRAEVTIELNKENEIEGVTRISVSGERLGNAAKNELCSIYGVDMIYEK